MVSPTKADGSKVDVEVLEEAGIELDCEDVSKIEDREEGPVVELTVDSGKVNQVENSLTDQGYSVENSEIRLVAHHQVTLSQEEASVLEKFYELVGEDEDVTQIHDNVAEDVSQQQATA